MKKTKVLWFTNTPSLYKRDANGYNGGGWIESLEASMAKEEQIDLGISFFSNDRTDVFKVKQNDVTYYPISKNNTFKNKLLKEIFPRRNDRLELDMFKEVVHDFEPDIIHVFGSEASFGLLSLHLKIPLVIHVQGILTPYLNAWFPPGTYKLDYLNLLSPKKIINSFRNLNRFKYNASREIKILKNCKNFQGRTTWDKDVTRLYSPNAKYFYCSEILREAFYKAKPWKPTENKVIKIISTISKVEYKGFDLILKSAKLLKENTNIKFEWEVYGISEYPFWEKKIGHLPKDLNINLMGVADQYHIIDAMKNSDVFVHPSYIDNSPNSVCEAQMVGIPVISTNVGGISSLISNYETGILIPANDPYTLVSKILELTSNNILSLSLSLEARKCAFLRHDVETILNQNLSVYQSMIEYVDQG